MCENTYTLTNLPNDTVEYTVSPELLRKIDAAGYCVSRANFDKFVAWIDSLIEIKSNAVQEEIKKFDKWIQNIPENINYICVYPISPIRKTKNTTLDTVKLVSLRNHERFHAQTLRYDQNWYKTADGILLDQFEHMWPELSHQIATLDTHEDLLDYYGYIWVAITESLARICAILHTDKKYRRHVASYQLENHSLMLRFAKEFEKIYGSAEEFIEIVNQELES